MEVEDTFVSEAFRRDKEEDVRGEIGVEGRISFFCFEAGRISSRSIGTPREIRKSRRMRERIQFGGWSGGGATSWDQREALRGVRKVGADVEDMVDEEGRRESGRDDRGKRASMYCSVAVKIEEVDERLEKSNTGCRENQSVT